MHRYAQTNLQLYAQLVAAEWTEPQLALAARGYEQAIEVCGGSCRANGKPFLCHLVGTASILASWGATTEEVVCGLVHSAYSHGAFADRRPGMTAAKRAVMREAVGDDCEAQVADYTQLAWRGAAIEQWAGKRDSLTPGEWRAIRVRLANELEEYLDLGMQFSRKTKVTGPLPDHDPLLVLAERLVSCDFSLELAAAVAANVAGTVPAVLVRVDGRSFRPRLQRPRLRARLEALWGS